MTGDFYGDTPDHQVTHYDEAAGQDTTLRERFQHIVSRSAQGEFTEAEILDELTMAVREAMLSYPSLQAAGRVRLSHRGAADIMIAALDAVTGDGR